MNKKVIEKVLERRQSEVKEKEKSLIKKKSTYQKKRKKWSEAGKKQRQQQRKENPTVRINDQVNCLIWQMIKHTLNGTKQGTWEAEKWLGYSIQDLMQHLENQFDVFMKWDNYGTYWVIDHIIPKRYFKFNSVNDEEFRACWSLENLRPLPKRKNYFPQTMKEINERLGDRNG